MPTMVRAGPQGIACEAWESAESEHCATAQTAPRTPPGTDGMVWPMNRTRKTIASLLVTGTAALGVIGCGSSSSTSTTAASGTPQTQDVADRRGGPTALTTAQLTTAAAKLDTTAARLKAALATAQESLPKPGASSSTTTTNPQTALYASVAKTLGTTSAKVKAALAGVLPTMPTGGQGGGPGGTPPSGGQGGTPPSGSAGGTPPAQGGTATTTSGASASS